METKSNISLLGFRRRMMQAMASKSELPQGYFPCEYIESDGASFIDTGLLGKSGLQVKCKCSFNDIASVHNVFGVLEGTNRLFIQYDNAEGLLYAYGAWNDTNASVSANEAYEMDATFNVGSQSFKLDGTELYSGTSSTNISTSLNAYLFALNLNGTPNYQAKMRLYYCKIYDNGTLVRDYIPCVNPEGYFGLYDNVTCEFYGFVIAKEPLLSVSFSQEYTNYNPDTNKYKGVYILYGKEVSEEIVFTETITIEGCTSLTCYIRSYAETGFDYAMISHLDKTFSDSTQYNSSQVKAHTKTSGNTAGWGIDKYVKVVYDNISEGKHTITFGYRKDLSTSDNDDNAYLLIEKPSAVVENKKSVGRGKVILPSSYINAEYIEGKGNAWIDSGFKPNQDTKFILDIDCSVYTGVEPKYIFGADESQNYNAFSLSTYQNKYQSFYNKSGAKSFTNNWVSRMLIVKDKQNTYCNSILVVSDTYASFQSKYTAYIFCLNRNGSTYYNAPVLKLYFCQIHDNGVFIKFFIPCMKDGVFGLYEMFEGIFYSSEGSSEFTGESEDGNEGSGSDDVVIIMFTINGVVYRAEKGMTWGEWANSEYDSGGFFIANSDNTISNANGWYVGFNGFFVNPQEIIQEGIRYELI